MDSDNQTLSTIIHHLLYINSTKPAMAKLSTGCTSTNVFVLFSVAVCIMLGSSAPVQNVRQANTARLLRYGLRDSVSY